MENGSWTGVLGCLQRGEADVSLNTMVPTKERQEVVAFSQTVFLRRDYAYIQQPEKIEWSWTTYLTPFSYPLWITVLVTTIGVSSVTYLAHQLWSCYGTRTEDILFLSSFCDILHAVGGIFCMQAPWLVPYSWSGRLIRWTSFLTALILFNSYSANLIADLTSNTLLVLPFTSFEGLLQDGTYEFSVMKGTTYVNYFKDTTDPILYQIYLKYLKPKLNSLPSSVREGLSRVCRRKDVFMCGEHMVDSLQSGLSCSVMALPDAGHFVNILSFVLRKDSPFNRIILHRQQGTEYSKMKFNGLLIFCTILPLVWGTDDKIRFADLELEDSPTESNAQSESNESGSEDAIPRGGGSSTCTCTPNHLCQSGSPSSGADIDIRIVTSPPSWITCSPGAVYCCVSRPPLTVQCGTQTKINVPGVKLRHGQAYFGKYPWQALILSSDNRYVGSGALLDPTHVVTAAHTIAAYPYAGTLKVRLGEWDLQAETEPYKYVESTIVRIVIHPCFRPDTLNNDIAVITLREAITISPHINTVCMSSNETFTGQRCWVSGWGKDAFGPKGTYQAIQKNVDLPILDSRECQGQLQKTRLGNHFLLDQQSFLCAGGEQGKDACTGDGGSPLVCEYRGRYYLVGMVAWGIGCADPGVPGVYVNVANYYDWIRQQMDNIP